MSESKETARIAPSTRRQRELRIGILAQLGSKCSRCGFDDSRALHIDHVRSGGSKELRLGQGGGMAYYYRVLRDTENTYQLLCANCNAIKRFESDEALGQRQHKQPFKMKRAPKAPGYEQKPRVL